MLLFYQSLNGSSSRLIDGISFSSSVSGYSVKLDVSSGFLDINNSILYLRQVLWFQVHRLEDIPVEPSKEPVEVDIMDTVDHTAESLCHIGD
jgi:hypothetical protein